jgi:hypothetical protein
MNTQNEDPKSQDVNQEKVQSTPLEQPIAQNRLHGYLINHPKLGYLLGALIILLIAAGVVYWQQNRIRTNPSEDTSTKDEQTNNFDEPVLLPDGSYYIPPLVKIDYSKSLEENTSVTWTTPKKLEDLKLVFPVAGESSDPNLAILYYELGTRAGNRVIVAQAPAVDPGGPVVYFFERTAEGYTYMALMASREIYTGPDSYASYALSSKVSTTNTTAFYAGLLGPSKLNWSGFNLERPNNVPTSLFELSLAQKQTIDNFSSRKVATLPQGDLYLFQQETGDAAIGGEKFFIRRFELRTPSGFLATYNIVYDFFNDAQVPDITWNDQSKNQDVYRKDASLGGCGNIGAFIVSAKDLTTDLKVAGTTNTGVTIYEFNNKDNPTLKYFYELQGGKVYDQETSDTKPISLEEWYSYHPIIAVKNGLGGFNLMSNSKYGIGAECGKPVVYLYPTKPTVVSVQVGAEITVSEPNYGKGWKVLAQPNGELQTADGETYNSLFWEGLGHGDYPQVTSGFVIARNDVEKVITDHLKQLGLNEQESKDFKDFWLDKMPDKPYVRLTWFTTSQMDHLAPLVVLPRPDTVIRVFLDYQGLDRAIDLPKQQLSSIPRNGFTVIEWGGLLRK